MRSILKSFRAPSSQEDGALIGPRASIRKKEVKLMTSIKHRTAALLLATLMAAAGASATSATFASDAHALAINVAPQTNVAIQTGVAVALF
jgi:hypothetical protein